jgi:hypothetical protein
MIDLTVVGSRYWTEIPILVVGIGGLLYKDGNGNQYQEIDIDEKSGKWVFELVDSMLVARYVKIMSL